MKINKLKIAIIGGGINSAVGYAHYCAMNLSNKFEIVSGVFSKNKDINRKSAEIYNIPSRDSDIYMDYKDMLNMEKGYIDAVVILTPTDQHTDQVIYANKIGIPVICEKALTKNYDEMKEIVNSSDNNFISVVFNYLSYPMIKELKEIIQSGQLGKIIQIQAEMQQEGFSRLTNGKPATPQKWRLEDGIVPTISLDLGTHVYSLIKFLTNETPIEVVASQNSFGNFKGIIDDVNAIVKYTNDMICNIWLSKCALGNRNGLRIRVYGTEGSAEWFQAEPEYLKMADNSGKIYTIDRSSENCVIARENRYNRFKVGHPAGFIEALANFYEDVYDDIYRYRNNKTDRVTFGLKESEECIRLFEAVSQSSNHLQWVKI